MADIAIDIDTMLDELTLGELDELEDAFGSPMDQLSMMKLAIGCVWLTRRRDDPEFTLDDARATKITALDSAAAGNGADPTTVAASSVSS